MHCRMKKKAEPIHCHDTADTVPRRNNARKPALPVYVKYSTKQQGRTYLYYII